MAVAESIILAINIFLGLNTNTSDNLVVVDDKLIQSSYQESVLTKINQAELLWFVNGDDGNVQKAIFKLPDDTWDSATSVYDQYFNTYATSEDKSIQEKTNNYYIGNVVQSDRMASYMPMYITYQRTGAYTAYVGYAYSLSQLRQVQFQVGEAIYIANDVYLNEAQSEANTCRLWSVKRGEAGVNEIDINYMKQMSGYDSTTYSISLQALESHTGFGNYVESYFNIDKQNALAYNVNLSTSALPLILASGNQFSVLQTWLEANDTLGTGEWQYEGDTCIFNTFGRRQSMTDATGFDDAFNYNLALSYDRSILLVYEPVDIPYIMMFIITGPFAFLSQAFGVTLFSGTPYAIAIGDTLIAIIGLVMVLSLTFKVISIVK